MGNGERPVLAVYDFRSKQEFIYRTNKMREITGASELIAGMYDAFLTEWNDKQSKKIENVWEKDVEEKNSVNQNQFLSFSGSSLAGRVVYIGGGNLCILYSDRAQYIECNKCFSRLVLDEAYSLNLIVGCAEWEEGKGFGDVRSAAFADLDKMKRIGYAGVPCNVLPFTQVNPTSFQPIYVQPSGKGKRFYDPDLDTDELAELSRESYLKWAKFKEKAEEGKKKFKETSNEEDDWESIGKFIDDIGTEKGKDSLIAVIYSDGNSIGNRLLNIETIDDMRRFSTDVHKVLVENTETKIKETLKGLPENHQGYRIIIDHGDEITIICNAHAAPFVAEAYFEAISEWNNSNLQLPQSSDESKAPENIQSEPYAACLGIAICHAHDPFSMVYEIAEELCESGKETNRAHLAENTNAKDASYVDFHYIRSGILGDLKQIRKEQDGELTNNRPYQVGTTYQSFLSVGAILAQSKITRSDLKELNRAILKGSAWYELEYERIKAKDNSAIAKIEEQVENHAQRRRMLFDVTSFWDIYDLRFNGLNHVKKNAKQPSDEEQGTDAGIVNTSQEGGER